MALTNVLITGGCGFVGSAIARALVQKHPKCSITVVDLNPPGPVHEVPGQAIFTRADVTSAEEVDKVIRQVRPIVVIHTAGVVPELSERYSRRLQNLVWKTNVESTRILLDASKRSGVQAFVYTSSCCATTDDMRLSYANINETWPTSQTSSIYGESKVRMLQFRNDLASLIG